MFDGRPDCITKVRNVLKADLASSQDVLLVACLNFVATCGTPAVCRELFNDVASIANPVRGLTPVVRKKAYACMLRYESDAGVKCRSARLNPGLFRAEEWGPRMSHCLSAEHDVGTLLAVSALLRGTLEKCSRGWEDCIPSGKA